MTLSERFHKLARVLAETARKERDNGAILSEYGYRDIGQRMGRIADEMERTAQLIEAGAYDGEDYATIEPERAARAFHEAYERLAPSFGYETRRESAVPWEDVPEANRALMVAVAAEVLALLDSVRREREDGPTTGGGR